MNKQLLLGGIGIIGIVLIATIIYAVNRHGSAAVVSDYASCAKAGNATVQTYPAQCVTKDGRVYIQPASTETATTTLPAY